MPVWFRVAWICGMQCGLHCILAVCDKIGRISESLFYHQWLGHVYYTTLGLELQFPLYPHAIDTIPHAGINAISLSAVRTIT